MIHGDKIRRPAEVFPVGEYIEDELDAREWGCEDLAERAGLPLRRMQRIVEGDCGPITTRELEAIAEVFGQEVSTWLNIQALWKKYHKGNP